ncbi:M56 family metallopeptidase [Dyadobacter sp. CY323]|uniref:M56 family metallopeptidase n=1 Tax=Dyadobacter sp. CY323 TaxID=2907302 RepID=UPI001F22A9F2|nr:M56 family metallopeptidase [Dyadobacter sp. CY323]MCE6990703.1 M48 family metalloprotease [Dyadobacter sp. CY323]
MKIFFDLFTSASVSALGWTLIHSVWQAALLMLLAIATFYILKKKTANVRYLAAVAFLSTQLFTSIATFFYYYTKSTPALSVPKTFANSLTFTNVRQVSFSATELPFSMKLQGWLSMHLHELVICWMIGAAVLLLRFLGGWLFTEKLRYDAKVVMDREWRARFGVIVAKMNISQSIEFKETAKILTPMVIGAFSPVILIPIGLLSGFSTSQVEAILAHELAHIRRNDYLVNMLQSFVEVVFFFHPAIWWLSERIRTEREHCCDDIALSVCGDKMSLAHALVKVAEWQTAPRMAMAFASKKPLLLRRVQRVLGLTPKSTRTLGNLPLMLVAFGLVIGLSVYAVAQKTEKKKDKKVSQSAGKKQKSVSGFHAVENEIAEVPELAELSAIEIPDVEIAEFPAMHFDDDSLNKKRNEIHKRMQALQTEMEPLNQRMEEIQLEMEKQNFEVERFQRELEKIEWKKQAALELRNDLTEKRSTLLDRSRSNESKTNDSELDKQLADFEQQIKVQEETISQLNSQIASTRKDAFKAEEPIRRFNTETQEINEKIEEISGKIGVEALGFEKIEGNPRVREARTSRVRNVTGHGRVAPPPPPPAPARAVPAPAPKAPKSVAPPKPPVPPAKK